MTMRLGCVLAIALAIGMHGRDAAAKKPELSARIHGHALKAHGKHLQLTSASTVFEISADAGSFRNNRAIAIACVALDLAHTPLPTTLSGCNGTYQETRFVHRRLSAKVWMIANDGVQVTIDAFDGTRARGTFTGSFDVSGSGDPPATIQSGRFDAPVTIFGGG